ncbi:MAG TPA: fatty acid desaturase [Sphingomicrobium sp.]|nr:fatty acid desaturase [Sphingomicrobium sp.]
MRRQGEVGSSLAIAIILSWLVLHIYAVFFHRLSPAGLALAPVLVAAICWLNVGLFIIAHDAMHGSLAPGRPRLNLWFGRIALALYAAFRFDRLKAMHLQHHRSPGTARDPDFHPEAPRHFWPWYASFMRRYFGLSEFLVLCVPVAAYLLIGGRVLNLLLFWALPAALSSLQLFYFGTFLPHRHDGSAFADEHNARTNEFGWALSLATCFHFGYHHEHHLKPHVPWWGLPTERRRRAQPR